METEYYAFVLCRGHGNGLEGCGKRGLTEAQHSAQLARPDDPWQCPDCSAFALFDAAAFDRMHYSVSEA